MDVVGRKLNLHFHRRPCELFCNAPKEGHTTQGNRSKLKLWASCYDNFCIFFVFSFFVHILLSPLYLIRSNSFFMFWTFIYNWSSFSLISCFGLQPFNRSYSQLTFLYFYTPEYKIYWLFQEDSFYPRWRLDSTNENQAYKRTEYLLDHKVTLLSIFFFTNIYRFFMRIILFPNDTRIRTSQGHQDSKRTVYVLDHNTRYVTAAVSGWCIYQWYYHFSQICLSIFLNEDYLYFSLLLLLLLLLFSH